MKCLKPLLVLFFSMLLMNVKAQVSQLSKEEIITLLCHKWQATQMISGQRKMNVPPDGDYTLFRNDFTHQQKEDGRVKESKWRYNETEKKIIFASGDEYILKEISASKLVLVFQVEGMEVNLVLRRYKE